jgi:folate-binding protein YgfZ
MSSSDSSSFDREYQALKTGRAVVELTGWSSISVTGADRQTFLNNFCTNDVKRLVPGACCEAFFTNVKGKIVGHGLIDCREDELVFVGAPGQGSRLTSHLDRYVIREDVQLLDNTEARCFVFVVSDVSGPGKRISWDLVGNGFGGIIEVASSEAELLGRILREQGLVLAHRKAFTAARIEAGFPLIGIDFSEENLPQEVGRDSEAISFTKGCYLGQETVARIDALGHVNHKIVGIHFLGDSVPERGTELKLQGRGVGIVTSAAFSPILNAPLALAMVRREANSLGTRLASALGECEVIALPLAA